MLHVYCGPSIPGGEQQGGNNPLEATTTASNTASLPSGASLLKLSDSMSALGGDSWSRPSRSNVTSRMQSRPATQSSKRVGTPSMMNGLKGYFLKPPEKHVFGSREMFDASPKHRGMVQVYSLPSLAAKHMPLYDGVTA